MSESTMELQQQLLLQVEQLPAAAAAGDLMQGNEDAESAELAELRSELEWMRGQLLAAREQLENVPEQRDETQLLSELEQTRRETQALREQLQEAEERLQRAARLEEMMAQDQSSSAELLERAEAAEQALAEREAQLAALQESAARNATTGDGPDRFADNEEVAAERENLRRLQEEWHNKLRSAELEISVERARIARERAEMEERISMLETELQLLQGKEHSETTRGKWFARLGLKD
ncbi:MAG: hypothetical protein KDB14_22200 [Planctomycetales bacterium]|nr:hypothetical protein [Planctomycetales bacterium]